MLKMFPLRPLLKAEFFLRREISTNSRRCALQPDATYSRFFLPSSASGKSPSNSLRRSDRRSLSQRRQDVPRLRVEVALRHRRICLSLPTKVTSDISAIFEQQSIDFILRMTLEKDEQALSLLHERVDAPIFGPRENSITAIR